MIFELKKFKEYPDSIKILLTEELINSNNNITGKENKDINISIEERKKDQNLSDETLDEVYNKVEKLESQINSCFESIKDKIEKIIYPTSPSKIEKEENDYENSFSLTDEIFSINKIKKFEPKYNYFKPDENFLEIRLEVPGNIRIDVTHKIVKDLTIITVKGIKKPDKNPVEIEYNLYNMREFGEFEVNIPLKTEYFLINKTIPNEGYPKFVNGICLIQYSLAPPGETISANVTL